MTTGSDLDPSSRPAEWALVTAFPVLVAGVVAALPLLGVPQGWSLMGRVVTHLVGVVALGWWLGVRLLTAIDGAWFAAWPWTARRRRLGGALALTAIVTLVVGLVTLATSAALRLQPSLQFLQLLSTLDIAWVVMTLMLGLRLLGRRRAAPWWGLVMATMCVASLANYLRVVGFAADGGWLLHGDELVRLVIPADTVAALIAVAVLAAGLRQPIEQASDQS